MDIVGEKDRQGPIGSFGSERLNAMPVLGGKTWRRVGGAGTYSRGANGGKT